MRVASGVPPDPPPVARYEIPLQVRASVVAELRVRFPGVTAWYGRATHRWWAFVPGAGGRGCLVEARTPADLATAIAHAQGSS
jgi:hypothetical protein